MTILMDETNLFYRCWQGLSRSRSAADTPTQGGGIHYGGMENDRKEPKKLGTRIFTNLAFSGIYTVSRLVLRVDFRKSSLLTLQENNRLLRKSTHRIKMELVEEVGNWRLDLKSNFPP